MKVRWGQEAIRNNRTSKRGSISKKINFKHNWLLLVRFFFFRICVGCDVKRVGGQHTVKRYKTGRCGIRSTGNRFKTKKKKKTGSSTQSQTKLSIFPISLPPCVASSSGESPMSAANCGVRDKQERLEISVVLCQIKSGRAREKKLGFPSVRPKPSSSFLFWCFNWTIINCLKEEQSCTRTIFCKTSGLDFSRRETTLQAQIDSRSIFLKQKTRARKEEKENCGNFKV